MAHVMSKAAELATKPRAALLATLHLMRGDPEALNAQMAAVMHAFSAALKSPEAHAAFQAFLSAGRKWSQISGARRLASRAPWHVAFGCARHRERLSWQSSAEPPRLSELSDAGSERLLGGFSGGLQF